MQCEIQNAEPRSCIQAFKCSDLLDNAYLVFRFLIYSTNIYSVLVTEETLPRVRDKTMNKR